jgi:hypothetical protein
MNGPRNGVDSSCAPSIWALGGSHSADYHLCKIAMGEIVDWMKFEGHEESQPAQAQAWLGEFDGISVEFPTFTKCISAR